MLNTNISKNGNSFYILIPAYLAESFGVTNGQDVEITLEGEKIIFFVKKSEKEK